MVFQASRLGPSNPIAASKLPGGDQSRDPAFIKRSRFSICSNRPAGTGLFWRLVAQFG